MKEFCYKDEEVLEKAFVLLNVKIFQNKIIIK